MMPIVQHHQIIRNNLRFFLGIITLLVSIGSLFIYSSSSVYALDRYGSASYFLRKQLVGVCMGLIGLLGIIHIPLLYIQKIAPFLFLGFCGLTALSLLPAYASHIHGSSRWIKLAFFSFQPSELLKIGFLLYAAYFLHKKSSTNLSSARSFYTLIFIIIIPSAILLKQPDFGFTVTLVSTLLLMCILTNVQVKRIIISMIGIIPLAIVLIMRYPYRVKRITSFLSPWEDPQGSGFQIIQSLIAIGSGGLWGVGIGQSRQKFFYLPMQHTDFIFSIIAEEIGFMGIIFLIMLYLALLYAGLRLTCALRNPFSRFFMLGFTLLISLQAFINIAVTTGVAPTKGVGLPFISYGNTNLITNLLMIGIIINMVKNDR